MATNKSKKSENTEPSFEQALARLESIVREMEEGSNLEELMQRFEEGTHLVKLCSERLNEVEKKIEKLLEKGDGTEPLTPAESQGG